jgi:hypothetical protein
LDDDDALGQLPDRDQRQIANMVRGWQQAMPSHCRMVLSGHLCSLAGCLRGMMPS